MKKLALFTSAFLAFSSLLHAQIPIEAPDNLRLQWSPTSVANPYIDLTWQNPVSQADIDTRITGFRVERRVGALAWPTTALSVVIPPSSTSTAIIPSSNVPGFVYSCRDLLPTDTTTVVAGLTAAAKAANLTITYRVRPISGTVLQRASEVITAGMITSKIFDTDGDGMSDTTEQTYGFNPNDWADATGDTDGDGFPNAWEIAMGTDPLVGSAFPPQSTLPATTSPPGSLDGTTAPWIIDVDPKASVSAISKLKIQDALNALTGGLTTNKRYRIIRVKPGTYLENLDIPENYHVAIIPWRSPKKTVSFVQNGSSNTADSAVIMQALNGKTWDAQEKFELIGTAPTTAIPVILTTGTFVLDSFRISRTAGSRDAIISVADDAVVSTNLAPRLSMCRLVNCVVSNVDAGITALVEHTRSRLVLSHCTFYMNSTDTNAPAHSYTTGFTDVLASTARLQIHNSIFWNPINTQTGKTEFQSIGEITGASCCMMVTEGLTGAFGVNPGVTPVGYISGMASSSFKAAEYFINIPKPVPPATSPLKDIHAPRDIHGEFRYRHAVRMVNGVETLVIGSSEDPTRLTDRGADQWVDADSDAIPDSEDRMIGLAVNAGYDGDSDLLNEAMEYLGGTDRTSADSPYLTINQARAIFAPLANSQTFTSFYTKVETDSLFLKKSDANVYLTEDEGNDRYLKRNVLQTIRVLPGGNISMGEFSAP
ncbi:MAG: thrombospondin type 3 repeat-containing protein [Verrucomicrobia bacterium]|nr:thrombospondin type 3 repeat-containing protein [Verrucomicrobiota bacterium]